MKKILVNTGLLLLLLIGLALVFNNQIKYFLIGWNSARHNTQNMSADDLARNNLSDQPFDFEAVNLVSTESVIQAQFNTANLAVIGAIAVPDLEVHLPIFRGVSNIALLYGAGTMKPDQVMGQGNYALASHRVNDPNLLFSPLQRAEVGQMIFITDLQNIYQYKTIDVRRVTPDHVEVIDDVPGKKLITLVTCNDAQARARVIVTGELVKSRPVNEATQEMRAAMSSQVNQGYW